MTPCGYDPRRRYWAFVFRLPDGMYGTSVRTYPREMSDDEVLADFKELLQLNKPGAVLTEYLRQPDTVH